jgi:uncharacterized protein YccT (UPF0319 family)
LALVLISLLATCRQNEVTGPAATGPAAELAITTPPVATAASGVAFSQQPVVQLQDAAGNPVSQAGVVVTAAIASGTGALGGTITATTNANGAAAFVGLSIVGTIGDRTLYFSSPSLTGATSGTITITPGVPAQLSITAQPSATAASGGPFAQQPSLQLRDASGNAVSLAGFTVTATVATGGGTLGGATSALTNSSGMANFTNLTITGAAGVFTLNFSAPALTGATSAPTTLTPGVATQLTITTQPSVTAASGVAFARQPLIQLRDAAGNAVSQLGTVVTASIATGGGTLGGTVTATTNASGVATFFNLAITGATGDRTLNFSAPALAGATSTSTTVTGSLATQLTITTQPSTTTASGAALAQQPVIQVRDAGGVAVSQAGTVVTAALASGTGTLGGTLTATTDASGVATFANLSVSGAAGTFTLSFSAPALTGATSGTITITVTVGPAAQLTITTQPSATVTSGVAFPQQPVIQLRDAGGLAVSQAGVVVTAALASGTGTLGGTLTATTDASGAATFANLAITGAAGAFTVSFSAPSLTGATSGTITIGGAGAATQLAITIQPSSAATSGVAFAQQPVIQLRDAGGLAVSQAGVVVTAALASGTGTLGGTVTATTNASGVATFTSLTITGAAGAFTVSFSAPALTGATSGTVTIPVVAGPATQLTLTTQPSAAPASGIVFAQQPVVQLRDAVGNAVTLGGVSVTAAIATGSGALSGTATVTTNANGVAIFTNLAITGAIGSQTLSFSAAGYTSVISSVLALAPGTATQVTINTQPSATAASGVAFALQPVLQVRDAAGNAVSVAGFTVTAVIASGVGGVLSGATSVVTSALGVATFAGLSITGTPGSFTLGFSVPSLTGATSSTIALTPGAATQLAITIQPSASAASGVAFAQQPVIQLKDAAGNAVSVAGTVVTAAIATGGGALGGTVTASTNASGVATFFNLAITGTAGDRTLNFSSGVLTGATSSAVTVTASGTPQLTLTTQPSAAPASGIVFAQQPVVQLRDAVGNAVTLGGVSVTVAIATGSGTLSGTTTATTNASGVAIFTNLAITGAIGSQTLSFSAAGYTSVISSVLALAPGTATQVTINTQPSATAASGVAFALQPVLQVRDAAGNAVSVAGFTVTAVIASGVGGVLSGATSVVTSALGVATFAGLSITGTPGSFTLGFSVPSLTGATSSTIALTPGAATQLAITIQPSASAASGVAFAQQPVIQLKDAAGNAVSVAGTVVTAAIATGGGALGGTVTASTNASGVATFFNLAITGTAGDRTLNFSSGVLIGATSSAVTVTASGSPELTLTTQPSAAPANGIVFAQQPVVQLRDAVGNAVSQAGVVVTAAIASGAGILGGGPTATTNASGVAIFTNLMITGTIGNQALSFSAAGYASVTSNIVALGPGTATQITMVTQPSATAASGTAFALQPVLQVRDAQGNVVSVAGFTVTAALNTVSGSGTLGGATSVVTSAAGVASFAGLFINGTTPSSFTLAFSVPFLTGVTSSTIALTPGAATQMTITTQPSASAASGVAFAQQPVIQLKDAAGNAVSVAGTVVTAAIATGGGALGGTVTASTNASGVATFFNLAITGTAGDRTLNFSSGALIGATSSAVTVTASGSPQLALTTQPSAAPASGIVFAQQPVVQLRDALGNAVNQAGVVVTAAIASGAGTLGGTLTATTNASGVAIFTNLMITGTIGNQALVFSAAGYTSVTSSIVALGAGTATQVTINTQPSATAASGVAFALQPVLQVRDAQGNAVSVSLTVTATISSGSGTLNGPTSVVTSALGVATFAGLFINGTAGNFTLLFSVPSLTGATSSTIVLTAGAASQLTITTQPVDGAGSGGAFPTQPVIQLKDAAGNAVFVSGTVVTAALATGVGTLGGTLTATTNAVGVATFANLSITAAAGTPHTLIFTAPAVTAVISGDVRP